MLGLRVRPIAGAGFRRASTAATRGAGGIGTSSSGSPASYATFDTVNPFTEETHATVQADDDFAVVGKFVRAAKAQRGWAAAPLQDRTKCLHDFAR